jgi:hypothetical protein
MNPWRAYLLSLQDLARWTGAHEGMISSDLHRAQSPQMDVETPTKGHEGLKTCTRRKKDVAFGGTLVDLDPGDLAPPTWTLALEGPGRHHGYPRRHPELGFSSWTTFMRHWHMWAGFQAFGGPTFHLPCPTFHT